MKKQISGSMTVRIRSVRGKNLFLSDYTADFGGVWIEDEKGLEQQLEWVRRKILRAIASEKASEE